MTTEEEYNNRLKKEREEEEAVWDKKWVFVVVLGDLGRSPRMRYHSLSLAKNGYLVQLIGYGGSALPDDIEQNKAIWTRRMREPPELLAKIPRILALPLKVIWQWLFLSLTFFWLLLAYRITPQFILVQNPPALPPLAICYFYSWLHSCPLVIDWHNYGYSLLSLKFGPNSLITQFYKGFEDYFGKRGTYHLCVTEGMKQDLKNRLQINAITFYDRPSDEFRSLESSERLIFLRKMSKNYPALHEVCGGGELGSGRPGILISSTSWTDDEDFSILLSALLDYDKFVESSGSEFPKLVVFITGKGPLKDYYTSLIKDSNFKYVTIYLPWLEHDDYPKLISCADLGVSLHTSSSGLDLPMKVVDMFGAGLPVSAMNFKCISELVIDGYNGKVFNNSNELSEQIREWFRLSPSPNSHHQLFRKNIQKFQSLRWDENWDRCIAPIFNNSIK